MSKKVLKKIEKIRKFCSYLTEWETKRDYYVTVLLPNWADCYISGLTEDARMLFLEIREETTPDEWKNIVKIIINVKEHYSEVIEQIKQRPLIKRKEQLTKLFNKLADKYNFQGFIHTTDFNNFINIMKTQAIFSRNYIDKHNIEHNEIALNSVITKTNDFYKNFVRFYWRAKTPTNYRNEGIKPKKELIENNIAHSPNPVIFVLDPTVAYENNVYFTNVNAGSYVVKPCSIPDDSFNFSYIFHDKIITEDLNDEKHKIIRSKCAEFLYPNKVSLKSIKKIIFRNKADYDRAILILGYKDSRFCIDNNYFCNNWLHVSSYHCNIKNNNICLNICYNFGREMFKEGCNLLDYSHKIQFIGEDGIICSSSQITNFQSSNEMNITIKNKMIYKILCYYIDDIECIRIKIND